MRRNNTYNALVVAGALALGVSGGAQASSYEYPSLHKDPRVLGMGGANVAVGGHTRSMFTNPAGLSRVKRGLQVDILPLQIALGDNVNSFGSDLTDALDIDDDDEQREELNAVLREYRGENLHLGLGTLPAVSWRGTVAGHDVTFAAGMLADTQLNVRAHQGMGSEGLLAVNGGGVFGPVFGASYDWEQFSFGASVKMLERHGINRSYTVTEIIEYTDDDNDKDFSDDVVDGSAVGIDLGVIYDAMPAHPLRPTVGFSLLNVGDMDFGDAGVMPMTANIGAAIHPEVPYIAGLTLALDYVDIFNGYEQDKDRLKRLHLGAEAMIWQNRLTDFAVRAGLHQGHLTAGVEMRLAAISFGLMTYAEEVGAYGGQDADRRYMATVNIGW
ncbi:hypothetical protein CAI21_08290 [Alkalilimnicola ehrlichii]|uniref:DUF5723 domain-containing protein n=1 Tax=Alkalilimnicola ehrlichii TaxID=351052 RepID=A0A3E0WWP0_9GAMM|nr:hypothetical protein [Alkalilimnicola ehrlichii]RFA29827.1 hypothetical protein CAI21_08290 [Alkalilimnicola ehrlichii]RFA36415.1 hypothetical protein CAL65_10560 [Alkalilimnicola ehrlichii]